MATYSFKSVGKTIDDKNEETLDESSTPFGIKTPLRLGTQDGILEMNHSLADQFADNLRNLLMTNWGERLGHYKFGANLKPLTTEFVSQENFDSEAINRISAAVSRWMPHIDLENFSSNADHFENKSTGIIKIKVTYNIPALEEFNRTVQVSLYVI